MLFCNETEITKRRSMCVEVQSVTKIHEHFDFLIYIFWAKYSVKIGNHLTTTWKAKKQISNHLFQFTWYAKVAVFIDFVIDSTLCDRILVGEVEWNQTARSLSVKQTDRSDLFVFRFYLSIYERLLCRLLKQIFNKLSDYACMFAVSSIYSTKWRMNTCKWSRLWYLEIQTSGLVKAPVSAILNNIYVFIQLWLPCVFVILWRENKRLIFKKMSDILLF